MQFHLAHGVPALADYKQLLATADFAAMAAFSDHFLQQSHHALQYYRLRWGVDPLRTWSRQWEYPYVFQQVMAAATNEQPLQVLDAGSGVTFLPRLLRTMLGKAELHCCDSDPLLDSVYQKLNENTTTPVNFRVADMRKLPYATESMDVIYCISVLEHTREYPLIVQEFKRVLRKGGRLIVTFDVSLDGLHDISVPDGQRLLDELVRSFPTTSEYRLAAELQRPVLTTVEAASINPQLLPWRYPWLSWLKTSWRKKRLVSWPPRLSVYCLTLYKA